jgi:preprotein translocase subunit SecG
MTAIYYLAIFFFLFLCSFLCSVILIQESKSTGLGASFGGDSSDSVFGTATAEVLKKITAYLSVAFLASCVILSFWTSSLGRSKAPSAPAQIESRQ